MNLPGGTDWVWWLTAAVLGTAAVGLGAWSLLWDRSRRGGRMRLRCPKCWYDMAGAPRCADDRGREGWRCPECGRVTRRERGLRRTRRRWGAMRMAVYLVVIGGCTAYVPAVRERFPAEGWTAVIPTLALVMVADIAHDPPVGSAAHLLWDRRELSWPHEAIIALRVPKPTDEALRKAILIRPVWQADTPIYVGFYPGTGLNSPYSERVFRLECRSDKDFGIEEWVHFSGVLDCGFGLDRTRYEQELSPLPVGEHIIQFRVRGWTVCGPLKLPLCSRNLLITVRAVPSAEAILTPVLSSELDEQVRSGFLLRAAPPREGSPLLRVGVADELYFMPGIALGLRVEMLREDVVVGTTLVRADSYFRSPQCQVQDPDLTDLCKLLFPDGEEPLASSGSAAATLQGWSVRVTGDAAQSLYNIQATSYWAGTIEGPLSDFVRR